MDRRHSMNESKLDAVKMKSLEVHDVGGKLSFATLKGRTYIIGRPSDPWATQPIVCLPAE